MVEFTPKWAACIVYFNDSTSLNNLLEDLSTQVAKPEKIFICDNNSLHKPQVINNNLNIDVITLSTNKGFGAAANSTINKAISENFNNFILFSQDVRIHQSDATLKLVSALNEKTTIAYPNMNDRNTNEVFSMGGSINFQTGRVFLNKELNNNEKFWADGSTLAINKLGYESVKGFDEKYFMYFEDVDFCYRVKKAGFMLAHIPVKISQTPNGPTALQRSKNSIRFAKKTQQKWFLVAVIIRNFFGAIKSLLKLDFLNFWFRLKGLSLGLSEK